MNYGQTYPAGKPINDLKLKDIQEKIFYIPEKYESFCDGLRITTLLVTQILKIDLRH
eukprot:m.9685 g.9685  ORF g.9685 m.9685 type:complete len:57 (+) comp21547_c0_seq2:365-535(+)